MQLPSLLNFKCLNIETLQKLKSQHVEEFCLKMIKDIILNYSTNFKKENEMQTKIFNQEVVIAEY